MRVIEQLIDHLRHAGRLGDAEMVQLHALGFGLDHDLDAYFADAYDDASHDAADELSVEPRRRRQPARGSRGVKSHGPTAKTLAANLRHARRSLRGAMRDLESIAGRLANRRAVTATAQAAAVLSESSPTEIADALAKALNDRQIDLARLWHLTFTDAHTAPDLPHIGRTMRAMDALMLSIDQSQQVTKYAWLQRADAVAWALDVSRAQRALLPALRVIINGDPVAMGRWLRGEVHPHTYPAAVLVHTADVYTRLQAIDHDSDWWPGKNWPRLHRPQRPMPKLDDWAGWEDAAAIDPIRVIPIMKARSPILTCPPAWDGWPGLSSIVDY